MVPMKMTAAKEPAQIMRFTLNFWAAAEGGSGGGGGEALLAPRAAARVAARVAAGAALLAAARAAVGVGGIVKRRESGVCDQSVSQSQYWRHRMAQSLVLLAAGGRDGVLLLMLPSDADDDDDVTDGERRRKSGTVLSPKGRLFAELQLSCLTLPGVSVALVPLRQALMSLAFWSSSSSLSSSSGERVANANVKLDVEINLGRRSRGA